MDQVSVAAGPNASRAALTVTAGNPALFRVDPDYGSDDRGMSAAPTLVRVVDGMTTGLISCAPEATLRTVAKLTAAHRVHAVYVFDYGLEDDETVELARPSLIRSTSRGVGTGVERVERRLPRRRKHLIRS